MIDDLAATKPGSTDANHQSPYRRIWLAAILFGLIRFAVMAIDYPALQADPDAYRVLAEGWSASGTFGRVSGDEPVRPTAYRPPIYPWILSWLVGVNGLWLPGVAVLHVGLGCLTSLLTWDVARRLADTSTSLRLNDSHSSSDTKGSMSAAVPWLAGLMVAVDPILLRQSTLIMTETLAAFSTMFVWWLWIRTAATARRGVPQSYWLIGGLFGLSCLVRSSSFVWCPLLIAAMLIHRYGNANSEPWNGRTWARSLVLCASMLLVLLPWAVRNRVYLGSTIWTTTHGGYTLLLANNPVLYRHFDVEGSDRRWDEEQFHHLWSKRAGGDPRENGYRNGANDQTNAGPGVSISNADEVADDRLASQTALATIARSPWIFLKACLIRVAWFWAFWPSSEQANLILRVMIGGWYSAIFALFILGSWRGIYGWWWKRYPASVSYLWLPAVSLMIGLTAVHTVYWSNMRMRAPMIPMISVISVFGLPDLRRPVASPQPRI